MAGLVVNSTDTSVVGETLQDMENSMTTIGAVISSMNNLSNDLDGNAFGPKPFNVVWLRVIFIFLYCIIFLIGVSGNFLVIFVVLRNKAMRTITNIFITNLAASDIMFCLVIAFTPMAALMDSWPFGSGLCHIAPMISAVNVFVSTLTSVAIAVDRYFVIVHPFKQRIKVWLCIVFIMAIWLIAVSTSLPIPVYMKHYYFKGSYKCEESFPGNGEPSRFYTLMLMILQYIVPCIIIVYCYTAVSMSLKKRSLMKLGSKSREREEMEIKRKRKTNRMLISMIAIFVVCWLPLNLYHLITSFMTTDKATSKESVLCFLITHIISASSTVYNPFLYAFMNDNFRKEFNQIIPCLFRSVESRGATGGSTYTAVETQNSFVNRSPSREIINNQSAANGNGNYNTMKGATASYDAEAEQIHLHVGENEA